MAEPGMLCNRVLARLAAGDASVTDLASECQRTRKVVVQVLGKLMARGLIMTRRGSYAVTDKGRAFVAAENRVSCGPKGPLTGKRKSRPDTFQSRVWAAFRVQRKSTIADLCEAARRKERDPAQSAKLFMSVLLRAGVAVELPSREPGFAPTSSGFKRFALLRDLGPRAPQVIRGQLFDPNSRESIPLKAKRT